MYGNRNIFSSTPPVVMNLIMINVVMLVITWVLGNTFGIDLNRILGVYVPGSPNFRPYQIVTHMFMHGGLTHLFFNMFALWMFGRVLEQVWGSKRFLIYYLVTGLGAVSIHLLVNYLHILSIQHDAAAMLNTPSPEAFAAFVTRHFPEYYDQVYAKFLDKWYLFPESPVYIDQAAEYIRQLIALQQSIPTVGASGAVYGVLLAFGMLFPNTVLMLIFPPIPIKAKWMVIIYGGLELYLGLTQPGSSIAHFAHLGGMIFGFILIKLWQRRTDIFY
ncbi:rhomboid family intramembrane serine protease [Tenuifilum thalassicum]|uniref:Rhomboid family intramembrane serine protease n=1 Tax=Tenuifilum thalassicum TaxID=2590900 RepID=A0A7D4CHP2_9BACT|nr:rhomboid family intramembrane serine protease [Tenuifilum thalassicum]QKG80706.1 rhomboid family intramembrane serine protease [Tenuifilum thalassicum]